MWVRSKNKRIEMIVYQKKTDMSYIKNERLRMINNLCELEVSYNLLITKLITNVNHGKKYGLKHKRSWVYSYIMVDSCTSLRELYIETRTLEVKRKYIFRDLEEQRIEFMLNYHIENNVTGGLPREIVGQMEFEYPDLYEKYKMYLMSLKRHGSSNCSLCFSEFGDFKELKRNSSLNFSETDDMFENEKNDEKYENYENDSSNKCNESNREMKVKFII